MRARRWPEEIPGLPRQAEVEKALLLYLNKRTAAIEPKEVYGPLSEQMKLSAEQLRIKLADSRLAWPNLVQWARERLAKEKLMNRRPKGQWSLTELGRLRAAHLAAGTLGKVTDEDFWHTP